MRSRNRALLSRALPEAAKWNRGLLTFAPRWSRIGPCGEWRGETLTAHAPGQFTPAQVLEAGRRAEAEGRYDFAIQFYRHLTQNFPHTAESQVAEAGLARLSPPSAFATGFAQPYAEPPLQPPQPPAPARQRGIALAPVEPDRGRPVHLPARRNDYLAGRLIAACVTWFGAIFAVAGAGVLPIALLAPDLLAITRQFGMVVNGAIFGTSAIVTGLGLVLLGQIARAMMDQANATCDLAAINRAKAEHEVAEARTGRAGHN